MPSSGDARDQEFRVKETLVAFWKTGETVCKEVWPSEPWILDASLCSCTESRKSRIRNIDEVTKTHPTVFVCKAQDAVCDSKSESTSQAYLILAYTHFMWISCWGSTLSPSYVSSVFHRQMLPKAFDPNMSNLYGPIASSGCSLVLVEDSSRVPGFRALLEPKQT